MKTLALTAVAVLMSSTAMAASLSGSPVSTTVIDSVPTYQNYTTSVPHSVCRDIEVPVYEQKRSSGAGNIFGTIIGGVAGGLLGNQIGGGKGNAAATAAGAVGGALFGNHLGGQSDNGGKEIVGYRRENRCTTEHVSEQRTRITGYDVTVVVHGETKTFRVSRDYRVGERVSVNTTYTLN